VVFLLGSNPGNHTIVLNADEQLAAIGIGKSHQGARNLAAVVHLELKIELLMLALGYEVVYVAGHCWDVRV
jgi:hypothetical protein